MDSDEYAEEISKGWQIAFKPSFRVSRPLKRHFPKFFDATLRINKSNMTPTNLYCGSITKARRRPRKASEEGYARRSS